MHDVIEHPGTDYAHCYKCCLQLTPDVEFASGICPRCGYDLTIIDIGTEVATEEQLKKKRAQQEMYDLILMVQNWGNAQRRYIGEAGVDWSAPHDLVEEIGTMMMPWIARLVQAGYFGKDEVRQITAVVDMEMEALIICIQAEEDIMRLTGQWGDNEQEIKDYWAKKLPFVRQLSMRSQQRIASDS